MKRFLLALLFAIPCFVQKSSAQNATIQAIINEVNIDSLMQRTREISGEVGVTVNGVTDTIFSRNKFRPGNELCFQYARDKFISYGYQVDSSVFSATGKNLWAIKPGLLYPNEKVIICGHYDGLPNVAIAPAADDDGSGTAAVLEAARVLAQYDFEYTILFALWDEEEYSLAGSKKYADTAFAHGDQIHAVFNMDAIAHDSDNDSVARVHARPPGNSEEIADTVVAVNQDYNIGIDLLLINPGVTYSDHASFWNKNFGAVLIIQDWEGDPNPHYHLVTDKVDYFNVPYFHKMARLSIASTAAFAVPFVAPPAGVNGETEEVIRIFPNPVHSVLNIKWQHEYQTIQLIDLLGKVMYQSPTNKEVLSATIDVSNFTKGIYFVQLLNGNKKVTKKIVVN